MIDDEEPRGPDPHEDDPVDEGGGHGRGGPAPRGGDDPRPPEPLLSEGEEKFINWYERTISEDARAHIEEADIKGDFETFFRLLYSRETVDEAEAKETLRRVHSNLEAYPPLRDALGSPEGVDGGKTWWEILEDSQLNPPEDEVAPDEMDEDNTEQSTPEELTQNAEEMLQDFRAALDDPSDKEKRAKAEEALKHLRENDGKFAKELKKKAPWYYRVCTVVAILFYIYVMLQTGMAAGVKAYGDSASGSK